MVNLSCHSPLERCYKHLMEPQLLTNHEKKSQGRERRSSITQIHHQQPRLFCETASPTVSLAHGLPRLPETLSGVCEVKTIFIQTLSSYFSHYSDTCTNGTKEM